MKLNFTRLENIQRLTCKTRNTIGQSEASVNVDIFCKQRDIKLISNDLFSVLDKPKLCMIERITLNQGEKFV